MNHFQHEVHLPNVDTKFILDPVFSFLKPSTVSKLQTDLNDIVKE